MKDTTVHQNVFKNLKGETNAHWHIDKMREFSGLREYGKGMKL